MDLTVDLLRKHLSYDKRTGLFRWIIPTSNRVSVNAVAGKLDDVGYVVIRLFGRSYLAHRLAWFYVYGVWPDGEIDHRDEVKNNNRFRNLRDATCSGNQQHRTRPHRDGRTGYLGVTRKGNRFRARIVVGGETLTIGWYDTAKHAGEAYKYAKQQLHREAA